jgi:uncharacterized membrane protein
LHRTVNNLLDYFDCFSRYGDYPLEDRLEEDGDSEIIPVKPSISTDNKTERAALMASFSRSIYRSPLPPPEVLRGYDLVSPGLAERIVGMAERQSQHRMELEKIVVIGDHKKSWVGLVLGFVVACGVFYGSYDLVKKGHDTAGTLLGGSALATLVSIFVRAGNQRSRERIEKSKAIESSDDNDDDE